MRWIRRDGKYIYRERRGSSFESTLTRGERSNRGADEFAVPRFRARRVYLVRFLPDFRDPLLHFSSND